MFMLRRIGEFYAHKCRHCGKIKYEQSFWKRLKWKFSNVLKKEPMAKSSLSQRTLKTSKKKPTEGLGKLDIRDVEKKYHPAGLASTPKAMTE